MTGMDPSFSIVINTDGRAESLATTLNSLRWLDYPCFEVCVVAGPTPDATQTELARWAGSIKVERCGVRNLSVSRNIGIAMAAGEIVAFLDDDAIPEPEWLRDLAAAYASDRIGGAGGFVHDPSGVTFQYRLATADRLGRADLSWERPAPELNFPHTANFPHLLGANSSFRKAALLAVGGFDEEYEYYLDETDLACRLIDAGWHIAQVEAGYVHHKFMPNALRNKARVVTNWYPIVKNRIYFGLLNGQPYYTLDAVIADVRTFIDNFARDVDWAVGQGFLSPDDRERFRHDVDRAWRNGLARGLAGRRNLADFTTLQRHATPFLPFSERRSPIGRRRRFCFATREYPPGPVGGIGRYVHQLARAIAAQGHDVHVLAQDASGHTIDFEEGVWVHRIPDLPADSPALADGTRPPAAIWARAAAVLAEVDRIAARRHVDVVVAPIWDAEGIAVLEDRRHLLVTSLHTPFALWLQSERDRAADPVFMSEFGRPLLAVERRLLDASRGILANSRAIMEEVAAAYGVAVAESARVVVVPHGLEDWASLPSTPPPEIAEGMLRLLFVGRLELRKGIDVLLRVARRLLRSQPNLHLDLVGDDSITGPDDLTWRESFEADPETAPFRACVTFHGKVSEEALRGFYRSCDIFVAPSRFESFGLTLLEAMTFGKPVVGCRAGGMVEVVADGVSGLLAEPGDADSLEACVKQLVSDPGLRERMGAAARSRYEAHFTLECMADGVTAFLQRLTARRPAAAASPERPLRSLEVLS
jgi:glycogen synthase